MIAFRYLMLVVFVFWGSISTAEDKIKPDCSSYLSPKLAKNVSFCVQRSRPDLPSNKEPVVYFMHGLGGNETLWVKGGYSDQLKDLVSNDPTFPQVTFISFETEMDSFFSDYQGKTESSKSYETWFIEEFIPTMEKKFSICSERNCRGIAGVSMGGFGALKTAIKYPSYFLFAAANSPALPPFSIHEKDELWRDYFKETKIGIALGMTLLRDVRKIFSSEELYQLNDPISLVKQFEGTNPFPSLYFDVGTEDNFGFQRGYQIFKDTLDSYHLAYEAFLEEGGDHFIYHHRNRFLLEFIRDQIY